MPSYPAYSAYEPLVAAARPRAELWRLVPGVMLIAAAYFLPLLILSAVLTVQFGSHISSAFIERMITGDTPGGMLLLLWTFLGLALGPLAAVRLIHKRPAGTLFGPSAPRALRDFIRVLIAVFGFQLVLMPLTLAGTDLRPGLGLAAFLGYLPFALTGILIQTGAEELVFRGYLQGQLAARFRSPPIWIGIPAALFAWGHYLPAEYGPNAGMIAAWAFVFGILAADLTARTGNLGAALGFHMANNVAALLIVGVGGNLDGLALWSLPIDLTDPVVARPALIVDFVTMIVSWLLARLALRV